MRLRSLSFLASVSTVLLTAGCGGGGSPTNLRTAPCGPSGGPSFCVSSCSLGCSSVGCSVTEIAQNQAITLNFSQAVDPASVNPATFSIRTASGETPSGSLVVQDGVISFVPEVRIIGGNTFFGFRANQTYIMTLPGGTSEQLAIRSVSGDALGQTLTCTLNVTGGIVDPDGQPPTATLLQPTTLTEVPSDVTVLIEFSEFIDTSPFQSGSSQNSPVEFRIIKTREKNGFPGERECDPAFEPIVLDGAPRAEINAATGRTLVSFRPAIRLPSQVCVEATVTPRVRDLAGTPAAEQRFTFITQSTGSESQSVVEAFQNNRQQDREASSGRWGGGVLTAGTIGGSGILGAFDPSHGRQISTGIFEWNTDRQVILADRTRTGENITVEGGVFEFSSFALEPGETIRFVGSKPAQIYVRGSAIVEGVIESNGLGFSSRYNATLATGQPGAAGGAGGAAGGVGADKGSGLANGFDGGDGDPVDLLDNHAYAGRAVDTGGKGSVQYPLSGLDGDVTFLGQSNRFSAMIAAGGAGGGAATPGLAGQAVKTTNNTGELGPNSVPGIPFSALPVPNAVNNLEHFLIGGSGGGGGASHAFFSDSRSSKPSWLSGGGGTGGGGAIGFRVGNNFTMSSTGIMRVNGGNGFFDGSPVSTASPIPAPGGGGAGGALVFQVGGTPLFGGQLESIGGKGGAYAENFVGFAETRGGDGGFGWLRLETPGGASPGQLGSSQPTANANNVGQLDDRDDTVGDQSRFYATGAVFSPNFDRYVIRATLRGQRVIYSDDPAYNDPEWGPNMGPALPGQAIQFFVQGALVDASSGQPDAGSIQPWRQYVRRTPGEQSLSGDQATGYRFQILFDRTIEQDIEINRVQVDFTT